MADKYKLLMKTSINWEPSGLGRKGRNGLSFNEFVLWVKHFISVFIGYFCPIFPNEKTEIQGKRVTCLTSQLANVEDWFISGLVWL